MKCPLMLMNWKPIEAERHFEPMDCRGEECARWDKRQGICGDLLEAQACDRIANYLEAIAGKMPHVGQFRK